MFKWLKKDKDNKTPRGYISPSEIKDVENQNPVPELKTEDNGHKKILLLDDNTGSLIFLRADIEYIKQLQIGIKNDTLCDMDHECIQTMKEKNIYKKFLKIPLEFYDIISAEGELGAFSIKNYLKNGGKCDIAILDLIIGGVQIENGRIVSLNGIDVADLIWKNYPECNINFFTGCVLDKKSEETIQFRKLTGQEIGRYVIPKDPNIIERRIKIIGLLLGYGN